MSIFAEIDAASFAKWVATRPPIIQALCRRLPPDRLYLLKSSNHRVTIASYCEDGTVSVDISGEWNLLTFERRVFGVAPESLEECELPGADEQLGAILTEPTEIKRYVDAIIAQGMAGLKSKS